MAYVTDRDTPRPLVICGPKSWPTWALSGAVAQRMAANQGFLSSLAVKVEVAASHAPLSCPSWQKPLSRENQAGYRSVRASHSTCTRRGAGSWLARR